MKAKQTIIPIFLFLMLSLLSYKVISQTYVNQEWVKTTGAVGPITRTVSINDYSDNLIVVSNVLNGTVNKNDVLITKYDFAGNMLWQQTYNGSANGNDYGV